MPSSSSSKIQPPINISLLVRPQAAPHSFHPSSSAQACPAAFLAGSTVEGRMDVEVPEGMANGLGVGDITLELVGKEVVTTRTEYSEVDLLSSRVVFQGQGLPPSAACEDGKPYRTEEGLVYWRGRQGKAAFAFKFDLPADLPSTLHPINPTDHRSIKSSISYSLIGTVTFISSRTYGREESVSMRRDVVIVENFSPPRPPPGNGFGDSPIGKGKKGRDPWSEEHTGAGKMRVEGEGGGGLRIELGAGGGRKVCLGLEGEDTEVELVVVNKLERFSSSAPRIKLVRVSHLRLGADHYSGEERLEVVREVVAERELAGPHFTAPALATRTLRLPVPLAAAYRCVRPHLHTSSSSLSTTDGKKEHVSCGFEVVVEVGAHDNPSSPAVATIPFWILHPLSASTTDIPPPLTHQSSIQFNHPGNGLPRPQPQHRHSQDFGIAPQRHGSYDSTQPTGHHPHSQSWGGGHRQQSQDGYFPLPQPPAPPPMLFQEPMSYSTPGTPRAMLPHPQPQRTWSGPESQQPLMQTSGGYDFAPAGYGLDSISSSGVQAHAGNSNGNGNGNYGQRSQTHLSPVHQFQNSFPPPHLQHQHSMPQLNQSSSYQQPRISEQYEPSTPTLTQQAHPTFSPPAQTIEPPPPIQVVLDRHYSVGEVLPSPTLHQDSNMEAMGTASQEMMHQHQHHHQHSSPPRAAPAPEGWSSMAWDAASPSSSTGKISIPRSAPPAWSSSLGSPTTQVSSTKDRKAQAQTPTPTMPQQSWTPQGPVLALPPPAVAAGTVRRALPALPSPLGQVAALTAMPTPAPVAMGTGSPAVAGLKMRMPSPSGYQPQLSMPQALPLPQLLAQTQKQAPPATPPRLPARKKEEVLAMPTPAPHPANSSQPVSPMVPLPTPLATLPEMGRALPRIQTQTSSPRPLQPSHLPNTNNNQHPNPPISPITSVLISPPQSKPPPPPVPSSASKPAPILLSPKPRAMKDTGMQSYFDVAPGVAKPSSGGGGGGLTSDTGRETPFQAWKRVSKQKSMQSMSSANGGGGGTGVGAYEGGGGSGRMAYGGVLLEQEEEQDRVDRDAEAEMRRNAGKRSPVVELLEDLVE